MAKDYDRNSFRQELKKRMPGYKWTVRKHIPYLYAENPLSYMQALGTQSAGFNRMSSLLITRRVQNGIVSVEAKYAGFGLKSPWLKEVREETLARALRSLQNFFEDRASIYASAAKTMQLARINEQMGKEFPATKGAMIGGKQFIGEVTE